MRFESLLCGMESRPTNTMTSTTWGSRTGWRWLKWAAKQVDAAAIGEQVGMAVTNLAVFARRMDSRAKSIPKNVHKIVRSGTGCGQAGRHNHAYDEGTAKSNWLVSLNVPVEITRTPILPARPVQKGEANIQSAIAHAKG